MSVHEDPYREVGVNQPHLREQTKQQLRNIGWAVKQMQDNQRVYRAGWNGKEMYLQLAAGGNFKGQNGLIMGDLEPFVYMKTADGKFVPWLCSATDLLATDWEVMF